MSNDYYVYIHYRATTGEPFYVGKGKGRRIRSLANRNRHWERIVARDGCYSQKVSQNLPEQDAYRLEMETIKRLRGQGAKLCNMTDGGDGNRGYKPTAETLEKISKKVAGTKNPSHNPAVHTFINDELGIEFTGTQFSMHQEHGECRSGITMLCSGRIWRYKGWRLQDTDRDFCPRSGSLAHRYNDATYHFRHRITGDEHIGTQMEFRKEKGLNHSSVSAICRGKRKSVNEWECVNPSTPKNHIPDSTKRKISKSISGSSNHNHDSTVRVFKHKDGKIERCTSSDMRKRHGLNCHIYSLISGRLAHHKGWAYLGKDISDLR